MPGDACGCFAATGPAAGNASNVLTAPLPSFLCLQMSFFGSGLTAPRLKESQGFFSSLQRGCAAGTAKRSAVDFIVKTQRCRFRTFLIPIIGDSG